MSQQRNRPYRIRSSDSNKPDRQKKNPNSLCSLIAEIIINEFDGDSEKAADAFNNKASKSHVNYLFVPSGLKRIFEENNGHIKYWQLEGVANYFDIPTGVLLLFSRMRANYKKSNEEENRKILAFLIRMIVGYDPDRSFDMNEFKQWLKWYDEAVPIPHPKESDYERQLALFQRADPPPPV